MSRNNPLEVKHHTSFDRAKFSPCVLNRKSHKGKELNKPLWLITKGSKHRNALRFYYFRTNY